MKTMPALFLTTLLFLPSLVFGQARQYPDSIRVELPEKGAVVNFELRVYAKDKEIIRSFPTRLQQIVGHIKNSIPEPQWRDEHSVLVSPDKQKTKQKSPGSP